MTEIIDLEDFSKEKPNERPEKGKKYQIRVDREKFVVHVDSLKGKEILEMANKKPFERYQLNQKFRHGQVKKIGYDEVVDFTEPGIERFMTIPLDQQEGS
jgi:hypothetical protein